MDIKFEGFEKLEYILDSHFTFERLKKAVNQSCLIVEGSAKEKCPKDTGTLARSITSNVSTEGDTIIGEVGTNIEYGPYVEYGTGLFAAEGGGRKDAWSFEDEEGNWHTTTGQQPQPFLRPSLEENRRRILKKIGEVIING